MAGGHAVRGSLGAASGVEIEPWEADTGQAGGMGGQWFLKAARRPRQLTPTGTRQDFLLRISSLQAEGKVLATDSQMDDLGPPGVLLAWGLPVGLQAPSPPPAWCPSEAVQQTHMRRQTAPHPAPSPASFSQRFWGAGVAEAWAAPLRSAR